VGAAIRDEYEKRPKEDIEEWAKRLGYIAAKKMCENSCQSLSTSVFCDTASIEVEIIYTSEMLVPEVKELKESSIVEVKKEEKKELEGRKVIPKYILEQIAYLEERYKEAEIDEKMAIRAEIDRIKQRYGI